MLRRTAALSLVTGALLIGDSPPARAQEPRVEVSALYQALYDRSIRTQFPAGWAGDVAVHITDTWGVIADVGGAYRTDSDLDLSLSLFTLGGGARWAPRRTSPVAPFAQLVVGWARMGSTATIASHESGMSQTKFMLQPAVGVRIAIGGRWGIASSVSYRRIFLNGEPSGDTGFNELAVATGVRVGF